MILSAPTIRSLKPVEPFIEKTVVNGKSAGLSHAGYDIRIAKDVTLISGTFKLSVSMEEFNMPPNIMGLVKDKSSWARQGLSVFNTVIEPGWKGYLTLELVNHGKDTLYIKAGEPIAQVIFLALDNQVEGYNGKYQNDGPEPQTYKAESISNG